MEERERREVEEEKSSSDSEQIREQEEDARKQKREDTENAKMRNGETDTGDYDDIGVCTGTKDETKEVAGDNDLEVNLLSVTEGENW